MDPDVRTALLAIGIVFCGAFAAMTLAVAADSGIDIFTVVSLLIVALIGIGLVGAIRNPPDE
jgi:hypothetical protein